jgi:hypothetical protein
LGSTYSHREILDSMIDYYQIVSSRASFELICAQAQIHSLEPIAWRERMFVGQNNGRFGREKAEVRGTKMEPIQR